MIQLNEIGKQCPIPVIETKKAIESLPIGETVETTVDNEIATQNLKKFADKMGYDYAMTKRSDACFQVRLTVTGRAKELQNNPAASAEGTDDSAQCAVPAPAGREYIVVISSDRMGEPEEQLGKVLLKGFLYALSKKENTPKQLIFYNGGAKLTCEGSESLPDLMELEKAGTEILTCGTCLKFQNLEDKLAIGGITNMYDITEALTGTAVVVKPC